MYVQGSYSVLKALLVKMSDLESLRVLCHVSLGEPLLVQGRCLNRTSVLDSVPSNTPMGREEICITIKQALFFFITMHELTFLYDWFISALGPTLHVLFI